MKAFSEMCLSILIVLFLTSGGLYAQGSAKASYNKGLEHAVHSEFKKAKAEFDNALKLDPFSSAVVLGLETIEDTLEKKIKAQSAIELFKGVSNENKGQYGQAIKDYNKAIEIDPAFAQAYSSRGVIYYSMDQYDQAISDYNKAIEINPNHAVFYSNRGLAYEKKGQYDQAISDYNKAIEINPKYPVSYSNRGLAYWMKGQYDRAISDYDKAIEMNPKDADVYYNRGLANDRKGRFDEAISDYSEAIEINPAYADAYNNRGFIYLVKSGDMVKGCADWKKACELGLCNNYNYAKKKGDCQ